MLEGSNRILLCEGYSGDSSISYQVPLRDETGGGSPVYRLCVDFGEVRAKTPHVSMMLHGEAFLGHATFSFTPLC